MSNVETRRTWEEVRIELPEPRSGLEAFVQHLIARPVQSELDRQHWAEVLATWAAIDLAVRAARSSRNGQAAEELATLARWPQTVLQFATSDHNAGLPGIIAVAERALELMTPPPRSVTDDPVAHEKFRAAVGCVGAAIKCLRALEAAKYAEVASNAWLAFASRFELECAGCAADAAIKAVKATEVKALCDRTIALL